MKYSVVLPCRDEEESIGICIRKARKAMQVMGESSYEIIVSDSSSDSSAEIASGLGARVVKHDKEGYGNACLEGLRHASGDYIILGDADDTYDFLELPGLLSQAEGLDLVLGRRDHIHKGAMPFLNRYVGNPLLSFLLRLLFGTGIRDAHTGLRVISREALKILDLKTTGMEFASEMIIKALDNGLRIGEIPIHYYPRKGKTKMRRIPDGWRHLKYMMLHNLVH